MPEYLLRRGCHRVGPVIAQDEKGNDVVITAGHNIKRGETFKTETPDLHKRWPEKFALLDKDDPTQQLERENAELKAKLAEIAAGTDNVDPPSVEEDDLDEDFASMTLSELKSFAQEEGIDLDGATLKSDILLIIKKAINEE
jgi:hypothetical protein